MRTTIAAVILVTIAAAACAGKRMRVYSSNGAERTYDVGTIDSITFEGIAGVRSLCLDNDDVPGWRASGDSCRHFDTLTLFNLINGAAPVYIEQGLVEGIYQELSLESVPGKVCYAYAEDFGTPENAGSMMQKKKTLSTMDLAIPGYDAEVAAGSAHMGGCSATACFDRYYLEISLVGYSDIDAALRDAAAFLSVYAGRIAP